MQYRKGFSLLEVNIAISVSIILAIFLLKLFILNTHLKERVFEEKRTVEIIQEIRNEIKYNLSEDEINLNFSSKKYINKKNLDFKKISEIKLIELLDNSQDNDDYCEIALNSNKNITIKLHIFKNEKETDQYETNFEYK